MAEHAWVNNYISRVSKLAQEKEGAAGAAAAGGAAARVKVEEALFEGDDEDLDDLDDDEGA